MKKTKANLIPITKGLFEKMAPGDVLVRRVTRHAYTYSFIDEIVRAENENMLGTKFELMMTSNNTNAYSFKDTRVYAFESIKDAGYYKLKSSSDPDLVVAIFQSKEFIARQK